VLAKELSAKDSHKKVSCLRWKVFIAKSRSQLIKKRGTYFAHDEEVETEVRK
jgi:hypothetical protein